MATRFPFKIAMILVPLAIVSCSHHCEPDCYHDDCYYDRTPPSVPRGVYSVTDDEAVTVRWEPVPDSDVAGYGVYWNDEAEGYYERIGTTTLTSYRISGLSNGRTYFFAVDAYDQCGNSSDLNYEVVYDTPRPEGYGLRIWNLNEFPDEAGIDFSEYQFGQQAMIVPYDDSGADIMLEQDQGVLFISATADDTDVLVWGPVDTLDEIDIAPEDGWIQGGSLSAHHRYAYLVWTWDNHFAKFVVTRMSDGSITIDWAYQIDQGNPELVPGASGSTPARHALKPADSRLGLEGDR